MLTDINVDSRGLAKYVKGPEVRSLVRGSAEEVESIYRATVAKRSGRLARETRIETFIGGRKNDRWCARLTAYAPYAAAHEFGNRRGGAAHELRNALNAWEAS